MARKSLEERLWEKWDQEGYEEESRWWRASSLDDLVRALRKALEELPVSLDTSACSDDELLRAALVGLMSEDGCPGFGRMADLLLSVGKVTVVGVDEDGYPATSEG